MYGSLKGHLSLTWKIGVCFVENRSLFSKNWIGKSKFALKNWSLFSKIGSLNKGVCFWKWEYVLENGSLFLRIGVWKWKFVFENRSWKSEFVVENRGLTSVLVRRESLELWSQTVRRVRCLDIDEMEVNAEATTTRKQPFWTWPKTRSKISKKRSAKEERKEGKQNAEPPVRL